MSYPPDYLANQTTTRPNAALYLFSLLELGLFILLGSNDNWLIKTDMLSDVSLMLSDVQGACIWFLMHILHQPRSVPPPLLLHESGSDSLLDLLLLLQYLLLLQVWLLPSACLSVLSDGGP